MAVRARDVRRQALGAEAAATKQREVERPWRRAEGTPAPWTRVDLYDLLRAEPLWPSAGSTTKKWDVRERVCAGYDLRVGWWVLAKVVYARARREN